MIDPERGRTECDSENNLREARTERAAAASAEPSETKVKTPEKPREVVVLWGRCGFVPTELAHEERSR